MSEVNPKIAAILLDAFKTAIDRAADEGMTLDVVIVGIERSTLDGAMLCAGIDASDEDRHLALHVADCLISEALEPMCEAFHAEVDTEDVPVSGTVH